jgi:hypothetical protein
MRLECLPCLIYADRFVCDLIFGQTGDQTADTDYVACTAAGLVTAQTGVAAARHEEWAGRRGVVERVELCGWGGDGVLGVGMARRVYGGGGGGASAFAVRTGVRRVA